MAQISGNPGRFQKSSDPESSYFEDRGSMMRIRGDNGLQQNVKTKLCSVLLSKSKIKQIAGSNEPVGYIGGWSWDEIRL